VSGIFLKNAGFIFKSSSAISTCFETFQQFSLFDAWSDTWRKKSTKIIKNNIIGIDVGKYGWLFYDKSVLNILEKTKDFWVSSLICKSQF